MRVAFWLLQDSIQQWSSWIAGLHYVQNCLAALASLPSHEIPEIVAFVPRSLGEKFSESIACRSSAWLKIVLIDQPSSTDRNDLKRLEELVASYRCDLYFPIMTLPIIPLDGKVVAWIADYQHKHYPDFFSGDDIAYRDILFSFLSCVADRVVCSSETVQRDLVKFYPSAEQRSFVLQFTVSPPESVLKAEFQATLKTHQIQPPFAYLPYQFWSHKNHRVVFEAWKILKDRGHNYTLVCTGAKSDSRNPEHFRSLEAYIVEHKLEEQIHILGIVDRDEQWQLYRAAKMILQPSLFEGWSTSIEEARSLGKPILLSDTELHREQLHDGGHFFPPNDAWYLADLIEEFWAKLPDSNDQSLEMAALAQQSANVQAFGRRLIQLFQETFDDPRDPMAPQILPLLAYYNAEANARLAVIESLHTSLARQKNTETLEQKTNALPEKQTEHISSERKVSPSKAHAWVKSIVKSISR